MSKRSEYILCKRKYLYSQLTSRKVFCIRKNTNKTTGYHYILSSMTKIKPTPPNVGRNVRQPELPHLLRLQNLHSNFDKLLNYIYH